MLQTTQAHRGESEHIRKRSPEPGFVAAVSEPRP